VSSQIRYVVVNEEIREAQTTAMTIVAALVILMVFLGITMRQSVLGVIAVAPGRCVPHLDAGHCGFTRHPLHRQHVRGHRPW